MTYQVDIGPIVVERCVREDLTGDGINADVVTVVCI